MVSRPATWGKQNSLQLGKPPRDANSNVAHHSGRPLIIEPPAQPKGPSIFYPSMMAGGGTGEEMLNPESVTRWPLLMDADAEPPQFIPWNQRIDLSAR